MIPDSKSRSRAAGILLALVLAGIAQGLFAGFHFGLAQPAGWSLDLRIAIALVLLVAAMALFAWAAPPSSRSKAASKGDGVDIPRRWVFTAALSVYVASLFLYLTVGETALVRILWLSGMVLLVAAYVERRDAPSLSREDGRDILILVGITALAFILRYWRLPDLPLQFHGDIASQGLQALEILNQPGTNWFAVGWSNIPMFDYVMMAGTMRLFGADLFGLSLTAVIQGTLTIPALYLLGREMFGRWVGLLAAVLLAISYTHIHFSRIVTTASPLLFIVLTFYFLFRGLRLRRGLWFSLSGISLGLGLLVYYPARIAVVIVVLLFIWLLIWQRDVITGNIRRWFAFVVGSLLGFGPMLGLVLTDFQAFAGRGSLVTIWNPQVMSHLMDKYGSDSIAGVWLEQIKRTYLTFFLYPDASTHFGFVGPMVGALTAVLLMLGIGYSLRWLRDERHFTLVIWLFMTLLLGGVVTNDPPFWPHIAIVLPAVMLLAAWATQRAWAGLSAALPEQLRPQGTVVFAAIVIVAVVLSGVRNWQAYLDHTAEKATTEVLVARYIATLPNDRKVVLVEDPVSFKQRELAFMGRQVRKETITPEQIQAGALSEPTQPTLFILTPNHGDLLRQLKERYPGGVTREHWIGDRWLTFLTYEVVPDSYEGAAGAVAPVQSLQTRIWIGWGVAGSIFLIMVLLGLYVLIRRPASAREQEEQEVAALVDQQQLPGDRLLRILFGMIVALLLAYLAQRFYDGDIAGTPAQALLDGLSLDPTRTTRLITGTILYILAMVLFAISAPAFPDWSKIRRLRVEPSTVYQAKLAPDARIVHPDNATYQNITPTTQPVHSTRANARQQLALLLVALIPYSLGMIRFEAQGEDAVVRWLWLAGLLIFVGGQVIWPVMNRVAGASAVWSPRFRWYNFVVLAVILGAGLWLRYNRLDMLPQDLHGDMASMGLQARDILSGAQTDLFREGWANIPIIGFLPTAFFLRFFGNDLYALNLGAVAAGMLTLVGLYLLVWRLFDSHRLAALATAVLAINIPHIHFSRLAAYMDPWPFMVFALFFIVDGMRARRVQSFALAGVLLGLGVQMYYSGRALGVVLVIAFLYLLIVRRRWLSDNTLGWGLLVIGALIAVGPSLLYFGNNWEAFVERSRSVFLLYEPVMAHLMNKYGVDSPTGVMLEQIARSLLMFNYSIDSSTQFGLARPLFSSWLSPLLVLGFGYSLRRWRTPGLGLILIWLLTLMLFGSILTNNAPFWPRLVGLLPAAALLVALTFDRFWFVLLSLVSGRARLSVNIALGVATLAILAFTGNANWQLYEQAVARNARPQASVGRYLASLPPEIAACSFSDAYSLKIRETYFLAWPRTVVDFPADAPDRLLDRCPGPPFVWILAPNHNDRLAYLLARWPDGLVEDHFFGNGSFAFTSFLVPEGSLPSGYVPEPSEQLPRQPDLGPFTAYMPDGSVFAPQQVFIGDTSSTVWEIDAGPIILSDGKLMVQIGPIPDHDAVYDYIKLVAEDGRVFLFEAEDRSNTSGDAFAEREGADNHWWLQNYEPFSNNRGLVAQKSEIVPVLTTTIEVPPGTYTLFIGSFKGDPDNGPFGLGVRWEAE